MMERHVVLSYNKGIATTGVTAEVLCEEYTKSKSRTKDHAWGCMFNFETLALYIPELVANELRISCY